MADIAWLMFLALAAWGSGDMLLHRLQVAPARMRGAIALMVGLALLSYLCLVMGALGMLRPWLLRALVLGLAVWGLARAWIRIRPAGSCSLSGRPDLLTAALVALLIASISLSLLAALDPPTLLDLTHYHLRAPLLWLERGRVVWPFQDLPYHYPQGMEALFALGLAVGSTCMPQLLHFLTALATLWGVMSFARGRWGRDVALLAGLFYWSVPEVHYLATIPFVDLAWAGAEALAVLAFVDGLDMLDQQRRLRQWALVGILVGWAAAIKYAALWTALFLGLGIIWASLAAATSRREGWRLAVRAAATYAASAFALASFWYIKNWLRFGNPVYPFLWGGRGLAPADAQTWMAFLHRFGPARSVWRFLRLPWDVLMTQRIPSMRPGLFPYPVALAPMLLVFRRWERAATVFVAFFLAYLTAWYWTGTLQLRFILAPITLACLLAARGGGEVLRRKGLLATSASALLFLALALGLALQWQALAPHILPHAVPEIFRPELMPRW
mgnify:CR=1 FL=1